MKTFKKYLDEEVNLSANVHSGKTGIDLSAVRDNINAYLNGVTACTFITPYIALERVSKVLANYHIFLPKYTFMEGDSGLAVFNVNQFGGKVGMNDDGEVVTSDDSPFSFYFEYNMNDSGTFDVFAEIVDEDELQELMGDLDDELEDEDEDELNEESKDEDEDENMKDMKKRIIEACWKGYSKKGMKTMFGKKYPNCVKDN